MLKIEIEIDSEGFDRHTDRFLVSVVQPAIAAGVNSAASMVQAELIEAAGEKFDRPTIFTMKAFGVLLADPISGRDPSAQISIMPRQASYLDVQIKGGRRRAGDVGATKDGPLVPGRDAKLDQYGGLGLVQSFKASEWPKSLSASTVEFEAALKKGKPAASSSIQQDQRNQFVISES